MRLHILFEFKPHPWGGANQFLRALRGKLRQQDSYKDSPRDADALLVNLNPGNLLPIEPPSYLREDKGGTGFWFCGFGGARRTEDNGGAEG